MATCMSSHFLFSFFYAIAHFPYKNDKINSIFAHRKKDCIL